MGDDFDWIKRMVAREEELGELPPGGASGGAVAGGRREPRWKVYPERHTHEAAVGTLLSIVHDSSFGLRACVEVRADSGELLAEVRLPRRGMSSLRDAKRLALAWVRSFEREWPRSADAAMADYFANWRRSIRTQADAIARLMLNGENVWLGGAVLDTSRWLWDELRELAIAHDSVREWEIGTSHHIALGSLHLRMRDELEAIEKSAPYVSRGISVAEHWRMEREGEPGPDADDGAPRLWNDSTSLQGWAPAFNVPDDARPDWLALALEACEMVRDRSLLPEHAAQGADGVERILARWPSLRKDGA